MAIKDWTIRVKADFSEVEKGEQKSKTLFEQTNRAVNVQRESIEDLTKELKKLEQARDKSNDPKKIKRLNQAIKDQKAVISDLRGETQRLEKQGTKSFNNLSKSAKKLAGTLGFAFGVAQLIRFEKQLFQTALRMEAFSNRAKVVFGESIDLVNDFAKENANALGLTRNEFIGAAAAIGDILVPLGLSRQRAAEMSSEAVKLGSALKIFTGDQRTAAEIAAIVAKSLTGEVEGLKSLGVVVNQNDKEFQELIKTKMRDENMTLVQAKAVAIYETVLQRSSDAIKNQEENLDSLVQKQQEFLATSKELQEVLAQGLIPVFDTLFTNLLDLKGVLTEDMSILERFKETVSSTFNLAILANPVGLWINILKGFKEEVDITAGAVSDLGATFETSFFDELFPKEEATSTIRNIFFLRKEIKRLTDERNAQGTSIARILEIKKELKGLNDELNRLTKTEIVVTEEVTRAMQEQAEAIDTLIEKQDQLNKVRADTSRTRRQRGMSEEIKAEQDFVNTTIEGFTAISQAFSSMIQFRTNMQLKALEEQGLSEEELRQKKKEIARSEAIASRNLALFQATIDLAAGIVAAKGNPAQIAFVSLVGLAQIAAIGSTPIPQLAEGEVDIQGGTKGKDSIPAILMPGETVTTTAQTKKYKPILQAIHDDNFEGYMMKDYIPKVLNSEFAKNVNNSFGDNGKLLKAVKNNNSVDVKNAKQMAKYFARELSNQSYEHKYRG